MAYRIEKNEQGKPEIVIDGFEKGISDSPYNLIGVSSILNNSGITDMRCVNIVSVPGEASVAFSTSASTTLTAGISGNVSSMSNSDNSITITSGGAIQVGQAIVFAGLGGSSGVSNGTQTAASDTNVYWVVTFDGSTKITVASSYANFLTSTVVTITGTDSGTYASIDMGQPNYFSQTESIAPFYMIDLIGRAWALRSSGTWNFLGNTTRANASGNGIGVYRGYLFVFRNALIDYMKISTSAWTYGWQNLNTSSGNTYPHQFFLNTTSDSVFYTDAAYVGSLTQKVSQTFDPSSAPTYTWTQQALLLPSNEVAQSLTIIGTNLLVGGQFNIVYSWDRTSTGYLPIYIAENGIYKMLSINTNAFLFAGNRGRIYICNGSQANLWKKVPDHISGTVEPYFTWGGVATNRNQIYFGVKATTNADTTTVLTAYGGVWAIDIDTTALRLVQKLSYNTYNGFCSAIIALPSAAAGFSLYMGWKSGTSTFGVDTGSTNVYTGGQSVVYSDLIPVGTAIMPHTFSQMEYKLSRPLVSGESVQLLVANNINSYFTDIASGTGFTNVGTDSTVGNLSFPFPFTMEKMQWLIVKSILTGTNSSPSFVRLREIRIR